MDTGLCFVGATAPIRQLREDIAAAACSRAKVLISGESGVGKEVVARLIHRLSERAARHSSRSIAPVSPTRSSSPSCSATCVAALPRRRDRGPARAADGGTVFLDEVGEMSLRMQAVLLRFLESGEIQRVGSTARDAPSTCASSPRPTATARAHRRNAFREDLYFRLNVVHLVIPPLRERRDDIAVAGPPFSAGARDGADGRGARGGARGDGPAGGVPVAWQRPRTEETSSNE